MKTTIAQVRRPGFKKIVPAVVRKLFAEYRVRSYMLLFMIAFVSMALLAATWMFFWNYILV